MSVKKKQHSNHYYVYKIREYWKTSARRHYLKYTPTVKVNEKTGEIESDMINDFTQFRA